MWKQNGNNSAGLLGLMTRFVFEKSWSIRRKPNGWIMRRAKYQVTYLDNSFSLRESSECRMILLASSHKLSERL